MKRTISNLLSISSAFVSKDIGYSKTETFAISSFIEIYSYGKRYSFQEQVVSSDTLLSLEIIKLLISSPFESIVYFIFFLFPLFFILSFTIIESFFPSSE